MTDKSNTGSDDVLSLNPFHDWWLTELRSSLAPAAVDIIPPPQPEPRPESPPELEPELPPALPPQRSRAKLFFFCTASLFVGGALMLMSSGRDPSPVRTSHAASPPPPKGEVLVGPIEVITPAPSEVLGRFDRTLATRAIDEAAHDAKQCARGRKGSSRVLITFDRSGHVTRAGIASGRFLGTPIGACISQRMRQIELPAFRGGDVTVYKTIRVR
jgi:hypothetical protein